MGEFYAIDKESGVVRWSYDITQDGDQTSFHGSMLIKDELVIIGTDGNIGHVYAFDKKTGKVRWKYRVLGEGAPTDILSQGEKIYTVTFDDELICLDLYSGDLIWSFKSQFKKDGFMWTQSAALAGGRIFFGGLDGNIYALGADSGELLWTTETGARISTSLIILGDDVYFGTANSYLYRLSQKSGKILSNFSTESIPVDRPTIDKNRFYVFLNPSGGGGIGRVLLAVDLLLEKALWRSESKWSATKSLVWDHTLLTGKKGELVAYRLTDGKQQWLFNIEGAIRSIGHDENNLYIGTLDGMIYSVALKY